MHNFAVDYWIFVSKINVERHGHSACVMQSKKYLLLKEEMLNVKEIECYNPLTGKFIAKDAMTGLQESFESSLYGIRSDLVADTTVALFGLMCFSVFRCCMKEKVANKFTYLSVLKLKHCA